MIYKDILVSAGLTKDEAEVYEILLSKGELRTSEIWKESNQKRSNIYNIARELSKRGLVEEFEKNNVIYYRLTHPNALFEDLEAKKTQLDLVESNVRAAIPSLNSEYNKINRRPTVRFYEGDSGVEKVLSDSLTSKTEIYTFIDLETVAKFAAELNTSYVAKREKLKLKKKGIVFDSKVARDLIKGYHTTITDTKFMDRPAQMVEAVMQIYDGKISYLTLSSDLRIGVIIEDARLYELHKIVFENLWKTLPAIYSDSSSHDDSNTPTTPSLSSI